MSKTHCPPRTTPVNEYWRIRFPINQVTDKYNPNHDIGADCPVTWREHRLAIALDKLVDQVHRLETRIEELENSNDT